MTEGRPTSLEELRPETLDGVLGQEHVVRVLNGYVRRFRETNGNGIVPSLLFHGPPGTGKTTSALAFANAILGDEFQGNFMEMNASDNRKISDVREKVRSYAFHEPQGEAPFRILLLDEADNMGEDAQMALRRLMEEATSCRFILTANKPSGILPALHSRCLVLAFRPLSDETMRTVLRSAADRLGLTLEESLLESLVARSDGRARDAINSLTGGDDESRKWASLGEKITTLFQPNGASRGAKIEAFVAFLRTEGFDQWEDVVVEIDRVVRSKCLIAADQVPGFIEQLAQCSFRCATVKVPLIQIRSTLYKITPGN